MINNSAGRASQPATFHSIFGGPLNYRPAGQPLPMAGLAVAFLLSLAISLAVAVCDSWAATAESRRGPHQGRSRHMLSGIPGNAASSYVRYRNCNGEPSVGAVVSGHQSKTAFSGQRPIRGTRRAFTLSQAIPAQSQAGGAAFVILGAITFCHLLNDVMQALLPAIYPMLKSGFALSFGQIGLLTLIFQVTASLFAANGRSLH